MTSQQKTTLHREAIHRHVSMPVLVTRPPICLLLVALAIAGCGPVNTHSAGSGSAATTPGPSGSLAAVDQAGPIVVLRDPSPGMLDVSMAVTFEQQTGDAQPMLEIGLGFTSGGKTVRFAGEERVTCFGTDLRLSDRDAVFQVLRAPVGQLPDTIVACNYSAGGVLASLILQIPSPPAITSPRQGAQITRDPRTLVTYQFDPATASILGVVALAPSSPSPKALARMNMPGPLQATVDTSGFAPGTGSLVLTASLAPQIAQTGARFKSVSASGTATVAVAVTWL